MSTLHSRFRKTSLFNVQSILVSQFLTKLESLTKFIKTPNYEIHHANRQRETERNGTANQSISTDATVNSAKGKN